VVGEPWALLMVRDLCVAPKTFEELRSGLPRMAAGELSARLEELEQAGVIRRRASFETAASASYELTEYGSELEDVVIRLGRWGARTLGGPRRDEIVTIDSMVMALRALFRPEAARGLQVSYMIEFGDLFSIHARIDDGRIEVAKGPLPDADLIIEAGPALKSLMAGEMSPREALENGGVRLKTGGVLLNSDPGLLAWFVELFHISPAPFDRPGGNRHPAAIRAGHPAADLNGYATPVGAYS
jgi:DNA-binding HxlR family transcriptional regulator